MNILKSRHPVFPAAQVALVVVLISGTLLAEEKPRLERLIPDDVIAYARFVGVTRKVETFLESGLKRKIVASPLFEELREDRDVRSGLQQIRELEEKSGLNLIRMLGEIFRREVAIGFFLDFSGPQGVILAKFGDGEEARRMVDRLRDAVTAATGKPLEGTRSEYEGESIETYDWLAFLVLDDVLAIAGQAGILESVVDLAAGRSKRSVLHSETYGPVVGGDGPLFQLALRPNFLPAVRLPEKLDSLASLLFGGWLGAIHASELLAVDLDLERTGLVLRVASLVGARSSNEEHVPWFPAADSGSLVGRLSRKRELAVVEVHRDLAAWWANRADLVDESASRKLEILAQYMSVVFGGSHFERDVLSEIGSPVTLVARRQRYRGATPEPAIPEFAAIVPLRNAASFGETLLAAVQRLVGIARVEQLRKGGGSQVELVLSSKPAGDRVLHYVELKRREGADPGGLVDNFSPSLVVLDAHAVLSSTTSLAESLIGELEGPPTRENPVGAGTASSTMDLLVLDCGELRGVLEDNHGLPGSDTEGIRSIARFLELFDGLRLSSTRKGDLVRLSLELSARGR